MALNSGTVRHTLHTKFSGNISHSRTSLLYARSRFALAALTRLMGFLRAMGGLAGKRALEGFCGLAGRNLEAWSGKASVQMAFLRLGE